MTEASAGQQDALAEAPVRDLLAELARQGRVPGSGSVSALVAAMAAAVVAMAARASVDVWAEARGAVAQAEALRRRALPLADADAKALRDALDLLESTERAPGERAEQRDFRLGLVLAAAADVPLAIARVAADVTALAYVVGEEGSPEVRADAAGAAVLASGAAQAAAHLVEVNLTMTDDDPRVLAARALAASADSWAADALALRG